MSILVFAEAANGKIKKASLEAIFYGSEVARQTGGDVSVVVGGSVDNAELQNLGKYGAKKVLHVSDSRLDSFDSKAYTRLVAEAAANTGASIVILSYTFNGKAIAPRLSVRLKAGLVPGASALPETGSGFSVKKNVFSGKAIATYKINTATKIVAITPNTIQVKAGEGSASVESMSVNFSDSDFSVKVKEVKKLSDKISLAEAELVVSGGRGLRGPENWGMLEEMAEILGAATACSRAVADVHWRPHHEHVGQTGLAIRPNLYIAIAISGAIQHLAGVNSSKTIVVINNDPEAPFFKAADYGIIGDAFEVVPKLNAALRKFKAEQSN